MAINTPDLVDCSHMNAEWLPVISYQVLQKSWGRKQEKYNAGLRWGTIQLHLGEAG